MFRTLNVEVLGIVENMSHFVCPSCDETHHIFGEGGGEREAEKLGVSFLGKIPLDGEVRAGGDEGKPIVTLNEKSAVTGAFVALAEQIAQIKSVEAAENDPKKKGLFTFLRS